MHRQPLFLSSAKELGIVAASCGIGQLKHGVETAPRVLMSGPLPTMLRRSLGLTLYGNTKYDACGSLHSLRDYRKSVMERAHLVSDINRNISKWVYDHGIAGRLVLTLGGDHSIGIGSVSGSAKAIHEKFGMEKKLGVIWVDAHADINTPETSGSGNMHGMPLAFLTGLARPTTSGAFEWLQDDHRISFDKLVYIGIRDLDDSEKRFIEVHNIKVFTPFDVTHAGIRDVMDEVLNYLGSDTPIHLGFDIDSLDPSIAPSTGLPVPGGLTLREGQYICERLSRSGQLVAVDLVEVNPELGSEIDRLKTLETAVSILKFALGGSAI